jgi:hypothetical protein
MSDVQKQLKLLFSTFPPPPGDNLAAQLEAYAIALDGHDMRDIEAAVTRLIRGEVAGHNQSFAPSAATLGAAVIERRNHRLDIESRNYVRNQLPAPTVERTPESRARVAAMMQQAVAGLASELRTPDAEAERRKRAFQSRVFDRFDPPQTDEDVRKRLGFEVADSDIEGDMGGRAA